MVNIGERIRLRRVRLGWSATKLATLSGVTQATISRIENGTRGVNQKLLWAIAEALAIPPSVLMDNQSNVVDAAPDMRTIPVLDYVQAGKWTGVQQKLEDGDVQETISTNLDCPPSSFALRIRGNSMEPRFTEGDIVIINPTIKPRPGDYVVATDDAGDATFKQYREAGVDARGRSVFELVPLNPNHAPIRSDRQKVSIVGVMIEHRQYRRH